MMNTERQLKPIVAGFLAVGLLMLTPIVQANERESLEQLRSTTLNLINLLVSEGVLSKSKADLLIRDAEASRLAAVEKEAMDKTESLTGENDSAKESGKKMVRVQYVPEHIKNEMRDEIKKEVMAKLNYKAGERLGLPEWIDRFEWTGDMRLRYERDTFSTANFLPYQFANELRNANVSNTTEDRDRFRVRARLGANVKINDWLSSGIRMTTGSNADPVSPNQTLETMDSSGSSKFSFALDRAFLKAQLYPSLSVSGGRMANPFFSTDLVWDPDLAFDGVAATYTPKISDSWSAFATAGAFPIDEVQSSDTSKAKSKWLFAGQAGIQWKTSQATTKFGVALYDYQNVEGTANSVGNNIMYAASAPVFRQKGNSTFSINQANGTYCGGSGAQSGPCGLAAKFRELNLTAQVDLATFNPVHVVLTGDYVRNIGFDQSEMLARTGNTYNKENQGYQIKLSVGMPEVVKANDWQVFGAFKRLEADAVLDAFTDSDFHLGGTDAKGWILGANYGLDKNTWLTARWFSADEISGLPLAIDVLLVDLNAKF
jgi:hypothetical protein